MNKNLKPCERLSIERNIRRPHLGDFLDHLFTDFFEQKGDHLYDEDRSIRGGIARFHGIPVTVLGHFKSHCAEENIVSHFGMPCPEGYRKALRIMNQAEKFGRPIITFVDTPGAYPGMEAEEHGQGEAIARNLAAMSHFRVPIISVVTGEGNSGGALAISVANRIVMLENAVFSVLSPEGFASILWKDSNRAGEACDVMKMTAEDLLSAGVCDEIIEEPCFGAQTAPDFVYERLDRSLASSLARYRTMSDDEILRERHEKFRRIGEFVETTEKKKQFGTMPGRDRQFLSNVPVFPEAGRRSSF